jgi:hypothetical protein
MPEEIHKQADDPVKNIVGPAFATLPTAVLAGLAYLAFHLAEVTGWALAVLFWFIEIIFVAWLLAKFIRYFEVLGAGEDEIGSRNRQAYTDLREDLEKGGRSAILYSRWLHLFLDAVDRFFGDAGRISAPLWTAASLNRCLLLALIYPIVTIFVIWAISGHVGPAERALHLDPRMTILQRSFATAVIGLCAFTIFGAVRAKAWRRFYYTAGCIAAFVLAIVLSVDTGVPATSPGPMAIAPIPRAVPPTTPGRTATAAFTVIGVPAAVTLAIAFIGAATVATGIAGIGAALASIRGIKVAGNRRWEGFFLAFVIVFLLLACLAAARWLSAFGFWQVLGPLLLFLGLLTLLNAPFDWFSVGLTRALLRGGLQLGGWWPYLLAVMDAALAAVIIASLALAMVIGVQAFDALAAHGRGQTILPLTPLFDGIAAHPTAPEYWWIYALLLSTMIPSLVNVMIGWTSLLRGVPVLPTLLLRRITEGEAMQIGNRFEIALVLTGQLAFGVLLGIIMQVGLVMGIIGYAMPWFRLELLEIARGFAALNLPARVGQLFGVSL